MVSDDTLSAMFWTRVAADAGQPAQLVKQGDGWIVTMEASAGQRVVYVGEAEHDGITTVLTRVGARQGSPIPVEYRMHQRRSRWLVYDVIVEGVSLVANYRAQFNTIVRTSSYAELIRRMRERVAELTAPPALTSWIEQPRGGKKAP